MRKSYDQKCRSELERMAKQGDQRARKELQDRFPVKDKANA